jgi:hypothetical protein
MTSDVPQRNASWPYIIAVLGAFLIVAALVLAMQRYFRPAPPNQLRAAERAKALVELRAAEGDALKTTGWIDKNKGLVRLRIEDAMRQVEREWGADPVAARANLNIRVAKAYFVPPAAPPPPSEFE